MGGRQYRRTGVVLAPCECALELVGTTPDVHEEFHPIYSARKVMHPLLVRLLAIAVDESLLNS